MSFRDSAYAYISACPDDQVDAVLEILDGHNMESEDAPADGGLAFSPSSYVNPDSTGEARELANELIAAAPGCAFEVYDRPECEFGSTIVRYTPELGRWDGAVDVDGEAVFSARQVLDMAGLPGLPVESIRLQIGETHREQLAALDRARD